MMLGIEKWTGGAFHKNLWFHMTVYIFFWLFFFIFSVAFATANIEHFIFSLPLCMWREGNLWKFVFSLWYRNANMLPKKPTYRKDVLCVQVVELQRKNCSNEVGHKSPSDIIQYHFRFMLAIHKKKTATFCDRLDLFFPQRAIFVFFEGWWDRG